ncbi:MAG: NYN domain-containing protein [Candidatus Omnitrophota bacterium]|nr:MAG: NYN domain-containing protein [Candidatus Omnitrophota bacterium]
MDKSRLAVFIDYENIYIGMKKQFSAIPNPDKIVALLREDFDKFGEMLIGKVYAGWEDFPGLQSEFKKRGIEPIYVLTKRRRKRENGSMDIRARKNSADIALSLDAQDILMGRADINSFIFVTGDRDFLDIISRCKQHGKTIIIYGVGYTISRDLQRQADKVVQIEKLFGLSPTGKPSPRLDKPDSPDFDWGPFVKTLDQIEKSIPFVGLKYFRDKILGPSVGSEYDLASKAQLLNEAIAQEIIIVGKVANKGNMPFPVTAIKLNRECPVVKSILSEEIVVEAEEIARTEETENKS